MRIPAAVLACVVALSPAASQEQIKTTDLETASRRGAQIYAFDQAAWHTTDSMLAKGLPEDQMRAIRGWVVEPHGDALTVTYYGVEGTKLYAIYAADYAGGKVVAERVPTADADKNVSMQAEHMISALATARALPFTPCVDRPFNTVVLPPQADGTISVYLLTPMLKTGAYPFGGHHEVDIGADGKLAGTRDFSKACLVMEQPAKAEMAVVTHLLDPHPTEVHVYLSLWMGKPLAVATGKESVWIVEGAKIQPLDMKGGARNK